MEKKPFVTKEQVEQIVKTYPTPFHIYDEAGIRKNAEAVKEAFSWNKGFREYFAVKATPNPYIMDILKGKTQTRNKVKSGRTTMSRLRLVWIGLQPMLRLPSC